MEVGKSRMAWIPVPEPVSEAGQVVFGKRVPGRK
jgi:hypothetical protein